jgi:hypothetical protein
MKPTISSERINIQKKQWKKSDTMWLELDMGTIRGTLLEIRRGDVSRSGLEKDEAW